MKRNLFALLYSAFLLLVLCSCGGENRKVSPRALKLFRRGKEAYQKKELAPARSFFLNAVKESSGFANGWVMLGKTRFFLKDPRGAEKAFSKAISIAPSHVEARYYLARIHLLYKKPAKAAASLKEILQVDPNNARANYTLGTLYARSKNIKNAIRHFSAALREETMMARIRLTFAEELYTSGLKERAKKVLTPALLYPVHKRLKKQMAALMEKLK